MGETRPTTDFFREQDIAVFKQAARLFNVYIAVRRINPESLKYIGKENYTPKRIDCKAKTAKFDVRIEGKLYETAGLVIDCEVLRPQLLQAFGRDKMEPALKAWRSFVQGARLAPIQAYGPDGKSQRTIEVGYSYFTEMDRSHKHFGCIRWSPTNLARGGKYVHADYDLYAVAPADTPAENVFVLEERMGEAHSRSPYLMDVQNYVTSRLPGMIAHGEQDTYKEDLDDQLDVFYPDGVTVRPVIGKVGISVFYAETFGGRRMNAAGSHIVTVSQGTLWKKLG